MVVLIVVGVWVLISVPVALLLGALFRAGPSKEAQNVSAPPDEPVTRTGTAS